MSKKLIDTTYLYFMMLSVAILLVAAPLFFYVTRNLFTAEIDETFELHQEEFIANYVSRMQQSDIAAWNNFNRNRKILKFDGLANKRVFDTVYFDSIGSEYEPYREFHAPVVIAGKPYTYIEKSNLVESSDLLLSIGQAFLVMFGLLLLGILLLSNMLTRSLWRPFYQTLSDIRDFEIDKNLQPKFAPTGVKEFDRLNQSIAALVEKNQAIYSNQRNFIENAAHELQTPLALFQSKIDNLIQLDVSPEQSLILEALGEDVTRMSRLNKNLLLLSKIDKTTFVQQEKILLSDHVLKNIMFFSEQADPKQISIVTDFDQTTTISANPDWIAVMVNNLFLNAIRHNIQGGTISIKIENAALIFTNTGIAVPLNTEKIFSRFGKSDSSAQGNGLGLAIVHAIAEANGWAVSYTYHSGLHIFAVHFK